MDGCVSISGWNFFPALNILWPSISFLPFFVLSLSTLLNPQHGYFPLYRQWIPHKLLIRSSVSCLHCFLLLQPSAQYSTLKSWYSSCHCHDDWCLFMSCQTPTLCCWQCLWCEAREGLVQLLRHHCSPCPNTPLGWYVPHVFIVSIVGCAPSS